MPAINPQLPPVRLILSPKLGFGTDVSMPLSHTFNCFMSLQAFVNGVSEVGFGVEPKHFPWLRLQLAPQLQLSLRVPLLRASSQKAFHGGALATLTDGGALRKLDPTSRETLASSLVQILVPALELQHRTTMLNAVMDERELTALRTSLSEIHDKREARRARARRDLQSTLDPPGPPAIDPRERSGEGSRTVHVRRELSERARELARRARVDLKGGPHAPEFSQDAARARRRRAWNEDDPSASGNEDTKDGPDTPAGFVAPHRILLGMTSRPGGRCVPRRA